MFSCPVRASMLLTRSLSMSRLTCLIHCVVVILCTKLMILFVSHRISTFFSSCLLLSLTFDSFSVDSLFCSLYLFSVRLAPRITLIIFLYSLSIFCISPFLVILESRSRTVPLVRSLCCIVWPYCSYIWLGNERWKTCLKKRGKLWG